ncbi:MAG: YIP1 family protein [Aeromicrobium sp.]|nr:YIP1 family protein [Aeromicrobium sp.]
MRALTSVLLGLFRPATGFDRAGAATRWLWMPLLALLVLSVAIKAGVATPLQTAATEEQSRQALEREMESWPEEQRRQYERDMAQFEADMGLEEGGAMQAATSIAATAALVFGVLGAVAAVLYVATFFFVAAKTWASPVRYPVMLTVAALSLVPHAFRNLLQAAYMSATGTWLQHSGLGALVAPADPMQPPGVAYAVLAQLDIWVLWGLAILFATLLSQTVGFARKRAVTALLTFVGVTGVLQALPTIIASAFMGAVM